jgi:1-deoxy-D-xylulose-5-phosphate reductoisomerase
MLGLPDMRVPIQYALSYPFRIDLEIPSMDFSEQHSLTFEEPDLEKFPCLNLAYEALKLGITYPAALNAANEEAVNAFLNHKIRFTDIPAVIMKLLETHIPRSSDDFADYLSIDRETRQYAMEYIHKISRKL